MQNVTLTIAIVASVLVMALRPHRALTVYMAFLLCYPTYLVLSFGTIGLPAGRIIVFVLLFRCLCDSRIRNRFRWSRLDTTVALSMFVYVGVILLTQPFSSALENRGGFVTDTWFVYLIARFCITRYDEFVSFIKVIAFVLAPLAILGFLESAGIWDPIRSLIANSEELRGILLYKPRWGLTRAMGPYSHSIMFGTTFVFFLPLIFCLRHEGNRWRFWAYVFSGCAVLGTFSSMSSGPMLMLVLVFGGLWLERHKRWVKRIFVLFVFLCILVAVISNRPFYYVVTSYVNPFGGTGWHRAKLIDVAIKHFDEWWLLGCGGEDPGWGPELGRKHTDITNEYILTGVKYGIWGIIVLCGTLAVAFHSLVYAAGRSNLLKLKSLYWALGSLLVAIMTAFMSVSFFGHPKMLFYLTLGIIGSAVMFDRLSGGVPEIKEAQSRHSNTKGAARYKASGKGYKTSPGGNE